MSGSLRFAGRTALVTGAASGVGRATAVRLVAEGARVHAVDIDTVGLAITAKACDGPGRISTAACDVTSEAEVVATVKDAVVVLEGLDVLVNVARTHRTTPIERLTVDDLHLLYEVNLVGTALFCREAVPHLPRGGAILTVVSSAAAHGSPSMTACSASEGAVLAFSLSLAAELVDRGVRVVPVRSPARVAEPDKVAAVIAFAASEDGSYLTGAELRADGSSHT